MTKPLRILHFLWKAEIGGAERAIYLLVREQLKDPALAPAVALAQPGGFYGDALAKLGCPIILADFENSSSFHKLPKFREQISGFDIHHFHSGEPLFMLTSLFCRNTKRVYTHRGGRINYGISKQLRYFLIRIFLHIGFHAFSGNTAYGVGSASKLFHLPKKLFQVTYNGLEFDLLTPIQSSEEIRRKLQIQPHHTVIGTTAIFKPEKKLELLIEALAELRNCDDLRLLIVGDGRLRPQLEALVNQNNLQPQVIFAGKQEHIADYLQVMDIFCLPGLESFGNAAVEAMGMGIPTIVFENGGGLVEHIQQGQTGFIVKDKMELAEKLQYLYQHPEIRSQIGKAGSVAIREKYTLEKCAASYKSLYSVALLQ